ncbi:cytochrome C [Ensifer sp. IC3342]|nr:cytochrome C [Ensifer sp. BRP08]MCA1450872.1 cytochrome C [Ensifer sp. IC3342]
MNRMRGLQCAIAMALVLTVIGESAAADRARGRSIAQRWCSECHVVSPGQLHASDTVPTFAQIGQAEQFDEARLSAFLAAPHHSRMPDLSLTRSEIADLVAYIKAQRP